MSIQRWSHEHPTECIPVRYDEGDWIRYDDHVAAVDAAMQEAERKGYKQGYASHINALAALTQERDFLQQQVDDIAERPCVQCAVVARTQDAEKRAVAEFLRGQIAGLELTLRAIEEES